MAVHSSDPATPYLSFVARMAHPSLDAVSDALYRDRALVRVHAMRRTLWVFTPEIARLAHAACTVSLARKEWDQLRRWVARSGIDDPDAWLDSITDDGPVTRVVAGGLTISLARVVGVPLPGDATLTGATADQDLGVLASLTR